MTKKGKIITILSVVFAVVLIALAVIVFALRDDYVLSVPGGKINFEYGSDINKTSLTATAKGRFFWSKGKDVKVQVLGDWNKDAIGEYEVEFTAKFMGKPLKTKGVIAVRDTSAPIITLNGSISPIVSPVSTYTEEGYTAFDLFDGDLTDKVLVSYEENNIVYTVSDSFGNVASVSRTITVKDIVPPTLTLTGGDICKSQIGEAFVDPGFIATDDCDGDITSAVSVSGSVNTNKRGKNSLVYSVTDSAGNTASVTREVLVSDFSPPQIKLNGGIDLFVPVGKEFVDPGFSATDSIDGDITSKVQVIGKVDTAVFGRNEIIYTVTDSFGNETEVIRNVLVYEKQAVSEAENTGYKVVYLTFDDGPGPYTAELLDILDQYGVKATFFVTNQFPKYQDMIGEIYRRGHTVALHTYSHRYDQLYSSVDSYYNDLDKISKLVYDQTGGYTANIMRFPGGTNNLVSKKHCPGIMSSLSKSIGYYGYLYFDWNVDSRDAGGVTTVDGVYNNVISGISGKNVSVVLQHDIKHYSVKAVEKILFWGMQNGYTFLPITTATPLVQFQPQN